MRHFRPIRDAASSRDRTQKQLESVRGLLTHNHIFLCWPLRDRRSQTRLSEAWSGRAERSPHDGEPCFKLPRCGAQTRPGASCQGRRWRPAGAESWRREHRPTNGRRTRAKPAGLMEARGVFGRSFDTREVRLALFGGPPGAAEELRQRRPLPLWQRFYYFFLMFTGWV